MIIRTLGSDDWSVLADLIRTAFAGFPWYENLSDEEIVRRVQVYGSKPGLAGLVAEENGEVIGATWWDRPSLSDLESERGEALTEFATGMSSVSGQALNLVWARETLIHPSCQSLGVATTLKREFVKELSLEGNFLVLTRMRDDNGAIVRINQRLGFRRTGIRIKSSQKAGVFHEYWFLEIPAAW